MSSQRLAGKLGVRSLTMSQVEEPGGRSSHIFLTKLSHEARAALSLAKVAGTAPSATSQVDGVSSSVAPLACWQAAEVAPLPAQLFSCQLPHGPATPLPAGATAESTRCVCALAC